MNDLQDLKVRDLYINWESKSWKESLECLMAEEKELEHKARQGKVY